MISSYFTMVSVDEDGKLKVPELEQLRYERNYGQEKCDVR